MKKASLASMFTALFLLGVLAVTGITTINYARTLYTSLDPQIAHALIASLFAALVVAWFIARVVRKIVVQRMRRQLKDEVTATYQYFVDYWTGAMDRAEKSDGNPEALQTLDRLMALYGGTEVLKAHLAMREMQQDRDAKSGEMLTQFGKALLAMRRELGAGTTGISAAQLQQLVMPEPSAVVPAAELPQHEPAPAN